MEIQIPLILFTTLLAWSAGLFATQAIYEMKGKAKSSQVLAVIVSVILLAVGGIAVLFHLQHAERIFNGFGHITSGITQELIALVILAIIMVIYFIFLCRNNDGTVPGWVAWCAIIFGVILVCVCGHSYMMPSRPGWDSVFQVASLIGAACGLGPATMAFIASSKNGHRGFNNWIHKIVKGYTVGTDDGPEIADDDPKEISGKANQIGQVVNAVLVICYIIALFAAAGTYTQVGNYFDPTGPTRGMIDVTAITPFSGAALPTTIVIIVGLVIAVFAAFRGKKTGNWKLWGMVIIIVVLIVSILVRVLFYQMGVSVFAFTDVE